MSIVNNRKAYYEYSILQEFDCGIILEGAEVKSVRMGNVVLNDSFIYIKSDEVWLRNFKISKYSQSHVAELHDDNRDKKLLLTKKEIAEISRSLEDKGITCIPLSVFVKRNKIKIKIGVAKGKKLFDKRNTIKERDIKREVQRGLI